MEQKDGIGAGKGTFGGIDPETSTENHKMSRKGIATICISPIIYS